LPKGCVAHALLVHKGVMLAGGHADHGEALWIRQAGRQPDWVSVTLPEGLGRRGKAIDALYVRGQVLVAIDNILRPKWVLVYPLDPELDATGVQKFSLASHTTYETIQRAAEGPDVYVLQSHGYNHGITSIYLSVIRKDDFAEIGGWSGVSEPTTQQLVDEVYWGITLGEDLFVGEPRELDLVTGTLRAWSKRQAKSRKGHWSILAAITDMVYCENMLVLALGTQGMAVTKPYAAHSVTTGADRQTLPPFCPVVLECLAEVHHLQRVQDETTGLYAIGTDSNGVLTFEWIAAERLQGDAACI